MYEVMRFKLALEAIYGSMLRFIEKFLHTHILKNNIKYSNSFKLDANPLHLPMSGLEYNLMHMYLLCGKGSVYSKPIHIFRYRTSAYIFTSRTFMTCDVSATYFASHIWRYIAIFSLIQSAVIIKQAK